MKALLGKRVLIKKPIVKKESIIEFTSAMEAEYEQEMMKKYNQLEVFAVGSAVTDVKAGDLVYVGSAIAHAEVLEIEGNLYFMINEQSISIIW